MIPSRRSSNKRQKFFTETSIESSSLIYKTNEKYKIRPLVLCKNTIIRMDKFCIDVYLLV